MTNPKDINLPRAYRLSIAIAPYLWMAVIGGRAMWYGVHPDPGDLVGVADVALHPIASAIGSAIPAAAMAFAIRWIMRKVLRRQWAKRGKEKGAEAP